MWAVVDRQWWLRWQRFTGCEEGADAGGDAEDTARAAAANADAASAASAAAAAVAAAASAAAAAAASAAATASAAPGEEGTVGSAGVDDEVERGGRRRHEVDDGGGGGRGGDGARESDSSPREGRQANDDNNGNSNGGGRMSDRGVDPSSSPEAAVSSAAVGVGASPPESSGEFVEVGRRRVGGQPNGTAAGEGEAAEGGMTDCEEGSDSAFPPDSSFESDEASVAFAAEDLGATRRSDGSGGGSGGGGSDSGSDGYSSVAPNSVAGTNGGPKGGEPRESGRFCEIQYGDEGSVRGVSKPSRALRTACDDRVNRFRRRVGFVSPQHASIPIENGRLL